MRSPDQIHPSHPADAQMIFADPLQQASREDLVALIQQQAEENQSLRDQAERFEHLYLDIVHSTSWKLAWPIRAAFKVLSGGRDWLRRRKGRKTSPAQTTSSINPKQSDNFDAALNQLLYFKSPSRKIRLNLLVSQPLPPDLRAAILTPLAQIAARQQVALRVISLDPALTARHCLASLSPARPASSASSGQSNHRLEFIFHSLDLSQASRSPFRLEMGSREIALALSAAADQTLATFLPPSQRLLIDPADTQWPGQLTLILDQTSREDQP